MTGNKLACCVLLLVLSCTCEARPVPEPTPTDTSCDGRKVGERWAVDCNQCYCNQTGQPVCTRKDCRAQKGASVLGGN
ncbi:MAG TPA: hypothetical protein VK034_12135 [Enhygromyxa sp.]|nr:hypothetical protein [Enhygromyxa sp.]